MALASARRLRGARAALALAFASPSLVACAGPCISGPGPAVRCRLPAAARGPAPVGRAAGPARAPRRSDPPGVRGALVLDPGDYQLAGTLEVPEGGMVLRGSGDGADPKVDTILHAIGDSPHQRTVLTLGAGGGSGWRAPLANSQANIT